MIKVTTNLMKIFSCYEVDRKTCSKFMAGFAGSSRYHLGTSTIYHVMSHSEFQARLYVLVEF